MGTPEFAAASLKRLAAWPRGEIVAVYTQPDRPAGRGHKLAESPVKKLALQLGLPVMQPASLKGAEAQQELAAFKPDLLAVAAYGLILPDAVLLRAAWMYDLPGYGLPIRGNFLLNLLTAAMRQETLRFSMRDYRGITYVREAVERLTQAMELPGGVYNFGSENDCDMVTTARRACALLDIHPVIEAADWPRSLLMDGAKLRAAAGVGFDDTLTGVQRCLRDYGLLK